MTWIEGVMMAGLIAFLAGIVALTAFSMSVQRRCLAAGYPHSAFTYVLDAYCVKRVDGTDVVVPVEKAGRSP